MAARSRWATSQPSAAPPRRGHLRRHGGRRSRPQWYNTTVASFAGGGGHGRQYQPRRQHADHRRGNTNTTYSGAITGTGGSFVKNGTGYPDAGWFGQQHLHRPHHRESRRRVARQDRRGQGHRRQPDLRQQPVARCLYHGGQPVCPAARWFRSSTMPATMAAWNLMGTTQTVAGIQNVGYSAQRGVIQNSETVPPTTALPP